jgi:hypothetical protein
VVINGAVGGGVSRRQLGASGWKEGGGFELAHVEVKILEESSSPA